MKDNYFFNDKGDGNSQYLGHWNKKNVYYPVYNKTYNEWREKHNMGSDFMIYSKPLLLKLRNSISIKLDTICRAPEPM
ncbi:DUF6402 family protein [Burkholderia cepacia]|uniref:DUF6402 family protein n=1 Tax=Burkholderia cepacia TaxID=292 RepID=UPI002ED65BD5